jgi:hypothetical protein
MASDTESDAGTINTEQFKDIVKEYIKIYDRLNDIRKDTAMLNKRKKKLSEVIISFMNNNDKELCNIGNDGSLQIKTSKTTMALKKEQVERLLIELGNSDGKAKETAQYLWEHKEVKERKVLKRNINPLL